MATMPHFEIHDTEYRSSRDERVKRNNKIRDVKYVVGPIVKDMMCCARMKDVPYPMYVADDKCISVKRTGNTKCIKLNSQIVIERL